MACQNGEDVCKVETTDLPISCKHLEDICEKCLAKFETTDFPKKCLKKVVISFGSKKGLKKVDTTYIPKKFLEKVQTSTEEEEEEQEQEQEEEDSNPSLREQIRYGKRKQILFDSALLAGVGLLSYYNAKNFLESFNYGVSLVKDFFKTLSTDTQTE